MKKVGLTLLMAALVFCVSCRISRRSVVILISEDASPLEILAAKEVRRYLYLRTGRLVPIESISSLPDGRNDTVVILQKMRAETMDSIVARIGPEISELGAQEYIIRTIPNRAKKLVAVVGGDDVGTLYGAYRLAEKMGVRFYLHGDVVPDEKVPLELPVVDERGRPIFRLRGIHPFHDFPEGPDWWNEDDYKAVFAQLAKLRLNFFGLHTYPEKGPNAEPTVWIGLAEDCEKDGTVRFSYPSSYHNSARGNWGYESGRTGDYHFGAAELFEADDYGAEVMKGMMPEPKSLEESNELFNRTGAMLQAAFSFGRGLGIRTCVGTESPLTIPELVKKRLEGKGKNPANRDTVKEVYRGLFNRIANAYPLDYYWIWTDENWTWSDASENQVKAVVEDLKTALEAATEINAPFAFATCGWVLGPPSDRTLFDRVLPKDIALSCINREVGKAPLDPNFSRISGRSKWAIPWLEDDPALTSPQLWVGRMRRDAADARACGCDGLLGIHWRTRNLGPNVSALAQAAWDQSAWKEPGAAGDSEGPVNGLYVSWPESTAGATVSPIYKDYRDRVFGYRLTVPNGTYTVILQFSEAEIKDKGRRVFDIFIQGRKVLEKLDIFARAGIFRPLEFRFPGMVVDNGRLDIDFADRIHYPSVAGLVVQGKNYSRKINCGGPAWQDYEADWPETPRDAATRDFYADWAVSQFGPAAGPEAAEIFDRIDGRLPQPNVWTGPGGIKPDPRPWEEVRAEYDFVDELAALAPKITGPGNQERFDYWLHSFLYLREMAHLECLWAEYNQALETLQRQTPEPRRAEIAAQTLLPIRERMVSILKVLYDSLLATVCTPGEMGTVMNWEQHLLPALMLKPGQELQNILGGELPASVRIPKTYEGPPRLIVPTVRTLLAPGEPLRLKVIILTGEKEVEATMRWRELGRGDYVSVPLEKVSRGVYLALCPETEKDIEYYILVRTAGQEIMFPATAPVMNQTVVRRP
jgi:hypothetical protein